MKIKGTDFVLYNVTDYERAVKFYRDVLGLKFVSEYGGYWGEFDAGNVVLAIHANKQPIKGGSAVALAVDDVDKFVKTLKDKGVKISEEPSETEVCFIATICDPDNNEIILHQRKDGTVG
ncbi:MAG: VOC family protein [Candidatus Paceibacterota bacterium]|jgi:predicted enzyme related to lactoylglutathione lyase